VRIKPLGTLLAAFILGGALVAVGVAHAAKIGPGDFDNPKLINFENAPNGPIGGFYSALGVSFVNLGAGPTFNTGTGNGPSRVACNFVGVPPPIPPPPPPPTGTPSPKPTLPPGTPPLPPTLPPGTPPPPPKLPASELLFNPAVSRAGFYITSDNSATTTVTAYKGGSQVGSDAFATGGQGTGGSFIGVEFPSTFDRLVISVQSSLSGAFCIDDLRFGEADKEPTPEPTKEPTKEPTEESAAPWQPTTVVISPPSTGDAGLK
jgi:hypothetical protein